MTETPTTIVCTIISILCYFDFAGRIGNEFNYLHYVFWALIGISIGCVIGSIIKNDLK